VIRFPVVRERNLEEFNKFSEEIYKGHPTREQELEWLDRQGPVVPELVEYLRKEHEQFDLLIFFTYLYYPTYYGLQVAPEKSVLLPTAHDEPPLKLSIYREMFQLPSSYLFNTEAEEILVLERFPVHKKMRETIGMGMELLDQPDIHVFRKKHDIPGKYLLYAGRIDAGKGLEELFRYFEFYKEENPGSGNLQLILIGKLGMKLPVNPSIRYIGFVDEGDKLAAMAGAVAVVQPSRLESLSIVTLEAFSVATPVIASAGSRVLCDHCRRSNAGLYYGDFEEFEEILTLLLNDRNLARSLGRNGQTYVKENFGWNKLLAKYELVFRASARPAKEPKGARVRPSAPTPSPEGDVADVGDLGDAEFEESEPFESDVRTEDLPLLEPQESEPYPAETESSYEDDAEPDQPAPEVDDDLEISEPPPAPRIENEPPREEVKPEPPEDKEDKKAAFVAPEEEDDDESGLPSFYRPRPRPADKPGE
jgi:glycosyltransferase involved in cell wall biosynthesis